jgi:Leucine-rich repeat (LRR) protein
MSLCQYGFSTLNATACQIGEVGAIFGRSFQCIKSTSISVSSNRISSTGLAALLSSYTHAEGDLTIDASANEVTELSAGLFSSLAIGVNVSTSLVLDLASNPLTTVSATVFANSYSLRKLQVNIGFPTDGPVSFPRSIDFANTTIEELVVFGERIGATTATLVAFNQFLLPTVCDPVGGSICTGGCGPTCTLTLVLPGNTFRVLNSGALADVRVTSLDLSNNGMTEVAPHACSNTTDIRSLGLSGNLLTMVPIEVQESLLGKLHSLDLGDNRLLALPLYGNVIHSPAHHQQGNVLQCASYTPYVEECTCIPPLVISTHCGYIRCAPQLNGCPTDQFPLCNVEGSTGGECPGTCSDGPWSPCIGSLSVLGKQYFDVKLQTFLPVTPCSTRFPLGSGFHDAYE